MSFKKSLEYECECGKQFILSRAEVSIMIVVGKIELRCNCGKTTIVEFEKVKEVIYES